MKITLIQCGHIQDNLKRISGDVPDIFHRFFSKYEPQIHFELYDATMGELPDENVKTGGFLFSGSAHSAYENEKWILQTKSFIRKLYRKRRKMVGICFGHQIIAESLGGIVNRSPKGWGIGVQSVAITKQMNWMIPAVTECNVLVSYQDQVETLPPEAINLGSNSHCRHFMYAIDNFVLSIQGHPEAEIEFAAALYNSRIEKIGHESVQKAINSLEKTVHHAIWARWIYNFLSSPDK
jgi:GMP synthase-like glutamine amidotransferase